MRYGRISPEDFKSSYDLDKEANAIVIAEIGSTEMVGNKKGWFSLEFKMYRRAHILNKNGYDIADIEIPIYTNGTAEERLDNLKGVTYNLENGKVVSTKLETRTAVFKDKINKNKMIRKFTFPDVKEGSIIEYEYTITSDFLFNLQPWYFQGNYPCLWSEYNVSMPQFFYYVTLKQGYIPYAIETNKSRTSNFSVSDSRTSSPMSRVSFTCGVTDFRWAMKNIPALKEEGFTSTLRNHVAKIEFQLAEKRDPLTYQRIMGSWTDVCSSLLKDEDFGLQLGKDNNWLSDVVRENTFNVPGTLPRARAIYSWVRDNMTCTNYNSKYLNQSLKDVLRKKNGNEAEINLLLIAMLRKAGFKADPVMLSTRGHGYAYSAYPLMDRFNYVICQLNIDGQPYYLDASDPGLGFGRLSYKCYNGHARVINDMATPLEFTADSLEERKVTSVFIVGNQANNSLSGSMQQTPGYYESVSIRNRIKDKGREALFADIKKAFGTDIEITEPGIDSLDHFDEPVGIHYKFDISLEKDDLIYFNPMLGERYKENPFKSAQRFYPVEMPYTMDETYLLRMDVPAGYIVDELPKQMMVKLNEEGDGLFEYRISETNGSISMRSRLSVKRAYFQPDEYEMLREFFNLVVKKQNEQIVFKKKP